MAKVLTTLYVESLRPQAKEKSYPDGKLPGFYIRVWPSGAKTAVRGRINGKQGTITLGSFPSVGVAEGRRTAMEAKAALGKGIIRPPGRQEGRQGGA